MTLAFFVLIQYRSVTDGQTGGQTFLLWLYQRFANALVKMMEERKEVIDKSKTRCLYGL